MITNKLLLVVFVITLAVSQVRAQNDSLQWFWSPGLGFYATNINEALAKDLGLARSRGFLVLAVARTGAANQAGLKPGDIVADWSPREIWSEASKTGSIQIVRDGVAQSLSATSAKMSDEALLDLLKAVPASRDAQTFVVDSGGSGSFRTLTAALFRAQAGDEITLKPGRYAEGVLLPPGISIRAAEKSLARVETKTPWLLIGAGAAELSGIVFSEGGLIVENGEQLTVSDCEFQVSEKKTGLALTNSRSITVTRSTFRGTSGTTGLSAGGSELTVSESIFMSHGNAAALLARNSRGEFRRNLMDGNGNGVLVYNSELTAVSNVLSGSWTPEKKDPPGFGFRLDKARGDLHKNVVRRHRYGIMATDAPEPVKIREGTVTQAEYGVVLIASPAVVSENLIMQNLLSGVYVSAREKEPQTSPQQVSILRNTLSGNERNAIEVNKFKQVTVNENLIEANGSGVDLQQSAATIENNTVVLQRFAGVNVRARAEAEVFNNIVAFNSFGLFIDVMAKHKTGYNNIFGNLASTEFPLRDGNYGRADRYVTRDGRKVPVDVYPAYDLKSETDISLDPGFVKLGSDYSLTPSSGLAKVRGKGGQYLGAYAPASFVSGAVAANEDRKVDSGSRELPRRSKSSVVGASKKRASNKPVSLAARAISTEAVSLVDRGDELMKTSKWEEALAAYQHAIQLAPNYARAFNALGWAYIDMGRFGDAFAPLVKAIQLNPQLAEAHYGIASAYLGADNYAKALGFLRTAVRLNPEGVDARFGLGQACLELGNKKCAEEQYTALKALDDKLARELYLELQDTPH